MSSPSDEGFAEEPVKRRRPRREDDEDDDFRDDREDRPRRRRPAPANDGGLGTIIPYRNGMALAAYYFGVFSLIPCIGFLLAPVAAILGFLGLNYAKKHPEAKGTAHAIAGIVLGTLVFLAHLAVILLAIFATATGR